MSTPQNSQGWITETKAFYTSFATYVSQNETILSYLGSLSFSATPSYPSLRKIIKNLFSSLRQGVLKLFDFSFTFFRRFEILISREKNKNNIK